MSKIICNRGLNAEQDLSFIKNKESRAYVKFVSMESKGESNGFPSLENVNPDLQELCLKMLEFNPHMRWSAKECLKSRYFDDVRIKQLEKKSKQKVVLDTEDLSL